MTNIHKVSHKSVMSDIVPHGLIFVRYVDIYAYCSAP